MAKTRFPTTARARSLCSVEATVTIRRRTGLILVGITGTLLAAMILLAPILLNADRYRSKVISYLEEKTGKKVEIGRLAVTFFPGLAIHVDDFGVKSPPFFPPSYVVKVARIDAQIDEWALLRGQMMIKSLVVQQPAINLLSDPDGPWNFENRQAKSSPNTFLFGVFSRVEITRGQVTVSNLLPSGAAGPVFFEAHDISSELENVNVDAIADPTSTTLDGQGTLKAGLLRFGSIEAKNLNSKIRLQARQVFFTDVKGEAYGGSATGELSIKLSGKNASFKTDVRMKGIEVAHLLATFSNARGKMTGKMEGELKIDGEIEHSLHPLKGLRGSGHLTVRNGQVPSLNLNANLMKLAHYNDLGPAKNDPSSFNLVSTDLELDHERISSKVIDVDGYGVDVDGSGSVSLTGSDEVNYQAVAKIVSKQGFVTNLFARLAGGTLKDGNLSFPFHIGGTVDNPVFSKGSKGQKVK
ncbi:MAG TPA: AsmA family protein [Desulfomonilaceae bacterium]|nr:AsmA family protein [Desulfomonilaceae bacterium]